MMDLAYGARQLLRGPSTSKDMPGSNRRASGNPEQVLSNQTDVGVKPNIKLTFELFILATVYFDGGLNIAMPEDLRKG